MDADVIRKAATENALTTATNTICGIDEDVEHWKKNTTYFQSGHVAPDSHSPEHGWGMKISWNKYNHPEDPFIIEHILGIRAAFAGDREYRVNDVDTKEGGCFIVTRTGRIDPQTDVIASMLQKKISSTKRERQEIKRVGYVVSTAARIIRTGTIVLTAAAIALMARNGTPIRALEFGCALAASHVAALIVAYVSCWHRARSQLRSITKHALKHMPGEYFETCRLIASYIPKSAAQTIATVIGCHLSGILPDGITSLVAGK